MDDEILLVDRCHPGVAIVTLNRPKAMNALSLALRAAIADTFDALDRAGDVHVVILTGAGRGFCAGLDLREMSADARVLADLDSRNPIAAIHGFGGVVIGAINGPAVTGGFELALACDILIASDAARFADTHARVGVMPGWQLSQRLSRTIGLTRAKLLSLSGRYISARQACDWGIVAEVFAADQLLEAAKALAAEILAAPPADVRTYKKLIDDGYALSLQDGIALETANSAVHNRSITPEAIGGRRDKVLLHGKNIAN